MQLLFTMRLSLAARFSVITGLIGFFSFHATAQQLKLGDNPSVLKKDAILELNSTNQGLLLPRVLKSQISTGGKLYNADNGMFVFVSDENSLYVKRFGIWQKVGDVSATAIVGDVDVTGSGTLTTTIKNKAVTYAKIQDVTTQSLLGRYAGTNGVTQEIKIGSNLLLNTTTGVLSADANTAWWNASLLQGRDIANTAPASGDVLKWNSVSNRWEPAASAALTTTLTGDVTGSGSGSFATALANKAVTFAKFQDVNTQTLLGRYSAASGAVQEVTLAGGNLALSAAGLLSANNGAALWNANKLRGNNVSTATPAAGNVLSWNNATSLWEPTAPAAAGITALTSDVTASGSGSVAATIAAKAVTYAKMQDVTASSLLGRYNAANGTAQEIKLGTNLSFNTTTGVLNASGITALTGDVTASTSTGSAATTIAAKAVTYAKMQDVVSQSLLGRYAAGNGVTQEVKIGSNMTLDATTGMLTANAGTALWNANKLQGRDVVTTAPANGDVLKYNTTTSAWEPAAAAAVTTTLTGDVTGSGSGSFATTVANKAVTFAKFQDIGTQTLLGRYATGTGSAQQITLGTNLALSPAGVLSASNTSAIWNANQLQSRALSSATPADGDILKYNNTTSTWEPAAAGGITSINGAILATGTGAVTAYISDGAVAYSKIQAMPGQTLMGRYTNSLGVVQEVTIGSNMTLNATTGALSANAGTALWNASQIQGRNVGTTAPTTGYVLKWNGTAWDAAADGGGGISALTGDVTASGTGSVAATIAAKAVTYAKIQDVTASSLLGRYSATNGVAQEIKIGGNLAFNTTTGTLSAAGITALTGDVTAATTTGSAATTIAVKAVTYAKFQDMPTQTLLGRYGAGTGVAQEVNITGGNLLLNSTTGILSADNNSAIWNANKILSRTISTNTPANGDVLKFNNTTSTWEPSADLSGGATYGTLANNDISQADAPDAFSRMKIWASPATGTVTNGPLGTGAYSWNVLSFKGNGYTTQLYFDKSTLGVKEWGGNTATLTTNAANPWYKMVMVHGDANIDNGAIVFGGKTEDASSEVKTDVAKLFWDNTNKRLGVGTAAPNSTFMVNGSKAEALTINTNIATYNLDETMSTVVIRRTGGGSSAVNVYLPAPSSCPGRKYTVIRDYTTSTGNVVLRATSGDPAFTYNGTTNYTMNSNTSLVVQSIGTRWVVISVATNI